MEWLHLILNLAALLLWMPACRHYARPKPANLIWAGAQAGAGDAASWCRWGLALLGCAVFITTGPG